MTDPANPIPEYIWYRDMEMLSAADRDQQDDRGGPTIEEIRGYKPRQDDDPGWLLGLTIAALLMTIIVTAAILIGANQGT